MSRSPSPATIEKLAACLRRNSKSAQKGGEAGEGGEEQEEAPREGFGAAQLINMM